ncbi:MAG: phage portal protein, partial [Clostridium sp.]|nr:phage portal protein [Clostridium sp.]
MMSLSAFLAENALPMENVRFIVSDRFVANGEPLEWEIKVITSAEDEALRKASWQRNPVPGRRGQYQREIDNDKYLGKLAAACTVFPNLNDKQLQESYHVMSAEQLLKTMLTPGEYIDYVLKVQEVNGFDVALQDEVDEAKN